MLSCGKTDKKQEVIEEKKEELAIEVDTATSYETEAIKLSEPRTPNQTDSGITSNEAATNHRRTIFSDRRINIFVTGLDGRIGYLSNIADANHVLSILIDAI